MAKKSSKASSPSWRTLRRQADQAPTSAQAAALVKEANRLRRAKRAKTKPSPAMDARTMNQNTTRRGAQGGPEAQVINRIDGAGNLTYGRDPTPGRGGTIGGAGGGGQGWSPAPTHDELLAQNRAEEISKLARSRGGAKEQIAMRLACWNRIAEVEARKEAEVSTVEVVRRHQEQAAINVVSGFIAQINGMAKANNGPLPRSVVVSGYTLARVIDALTKAGYTEDGFKSDSIRRLDRESVVNEMVANRTRR